MLVQSRDEDVKVGLKYDIQWYNKVQILTSSPGETKMPRPGWDKIPTKPEFFSEGSPKGPYICGVNFQSHLALGMLRHMIAALSSCICVFAFLLSEQYIPEGHFCQHTHYHCLFAFV